MDRILLMSVVGAAPGGVFGPGMCAGALEAFARDGRGGSKAEEGGTGSPAGGARAAAAAKDGQRQQQQRGADVAPRFGSASDARYSFLEVVVPH